MLSPNLNLHDSDFYQWTQKQVAALETACRTGTTSNLDFEGITEEIDGLRKDLEREVRSLVVLIVRHLLFLRQQPNSDDCKKWINEIDTYRKQLLDVLKDNPSSVAIFTDEAFLIRQWRRGCDDFAKHFSDDDQTRKRIRCQLIHTPLWNLDEILGFNHLLSADALPDAPDLEESLPDSLRQHLKQKIQLYE